MKIKCPHYSKVEPFHGPAGMLTLRCNNQHPWWGDYGCKIKKGEPPCVNGFIKKETFESLAYLKQANWLDERSR